MAKILITYGVPTDGFAMLQGHALLYPGEGKAFSKEEMLRMLPEVDAVLACTAFDKDLVRAGKKLKLIMCYGAGYDAIDVAEATACGIPVANMPETVTAPTAELAVGLLLSLARRIPELNGLMHGQQPSAAFGLGLRMGTSLEGAVLGIVGLGRIGARVAAFGRAMGMKLLYAARTQKPEQEALGAARCALPELMEAADFISIHCPLTPETQGLISREMLLRMKPTAFLINTSRGLVVDEEALIELLEQKRIAGAGLDVFVGEPAMDRRLAALPQVVMTPHVGSNTLQARNRMAESASGRILAALEGRKPENLLNPEIWRGAEV